MLRWPVWGRRRGVATLATLLLLVSGCATAPPPPTEPAFVAPTPTIWLAPPLETPELIPAPPGRERSSRGGLR
ncbi:MAG: hypothetical protein ACYC4L_16670, partial [Chloroflexota bacterium]